MPPRILYAEDHDDTRVLVCLLLRRAGFDVTEAANAREAQETAASVKFDLYLLEYTLPDASGVTLCETLRAAAPATPILFYSGRVMPEEREVALGAGAQGYLIKPDDIFNVAEHVAKLIGPK